MNRKIPPVEILTPYEAGRIISKNAEYIRSGLKQKRFDFGSAVPPEASGGNWNYNIIKSKFLEYAGISEHMQVNIDTEEFLYTVAEVAKLLKTNTNYVYTLINLGLLPALKLGSYKIRKQSLIEFLEKYEGKDLTDPHNIKELDIINN